MITELIPAIFDLLSLMLQGLLHVLLATPLFAFEMLIDVALDAPRHSAVLNTITTTAAASATKHGA